MNSKSILERKYFLGALSTVVGAVLALIWTRGKKGAGFDGFYYLKIIKNLADSWPDQFGVAWPYGYPLVGAFGTEFGLSAYWSLIAINFFSLAVTSFLSASLVPSHLRPHWTTTALFCGLGAAPVVPLVLKSPVSEWLFTALITLTTFLLYFWPKRFAIWGSAFTAFSSFCVRYAGVFLFGVVLLYAAWSYSSIRSHRRSRSAISSLGLFGAAIVFLLALNLMQTGHMGGVERAWGGGVVSLPFHAAHLGWAFVGSLSSGEVPKLIGGVESTIGIVIGWAVVAFILGLCTLALRKKQKMLSPVSLVIGGYVVSMIVLRSISQFNDLSQPRFALPVLYLLSILLIRQVRGRIRTAVGVLAVGVLAVGLIAAARGQSKEAGSGNITTARHHLEGRVAPSDTVLINGRALSLSAYFGSTFRLVKEPTFDELVSSVRSSDYAVFITRQKGRYGEEGYEPLPVPYISLCKNYKKIGRVERVYLGKTGCVLYREKGERNR